MAGRHGVPSKGRKTHARAARRERRRRLQRRDAAQPWLLWLSFRILLALVVLAATGWSALLIQRGQGDYWPIIAVAAGALSLLLIGLDVRARRRQRAVLRVPSVSRLAPPPIPPATFPVTPPRQYRGLHHLDGEDADEVRAEPDGATAQVPRPQVPRPPVPRPPGRHAHRR